MIAGTVLIILEIACDVCESRICFLIFLLCGRKHCCSVMDSKFDMLKDFNVGGDVDN